MAVRKANREIQARDSKQGDRVQQSAFVTTEFYANAI